MLPYTKGYAYHNVPDVLGSFTEDSSPRFICGCSSNEESKEGELARYNKYHTSSHQTRRNPEKPRIDDKFQFFLNVRDIAESHDAFVETYSANVFEHASLKDRRVMELSDLLIHKASATFSVFERQCAFDNIEKPEILPYLTTYDLP